MAGRKNLPSVDMLFGDLEETADELLTAGTLIETDRIKPDPDQPRKIADPPTPEQMRGLEELAASIKSEGVLQPVIVRPLDRDSYILVAGERRWRAARIAGLVSIPAIVREFDPLQARVVSLIENIQREDLNEDERADAIVKLKDIEDLTWKEVGEKVGLSEPRVKALARITREPESIRILVREGLSPAHLEVTRSVENEAIREEILKKAAENNIPVRQIRKMAKLWTETPHLLPDELMEKTSLQKKQRTASTKLPMDENLGENIKKPVKPENNIPAAKLQAALNLLDNLELNEDCGDYEKLTDILDKIGERVRKLRESIGAGAKNDEFYRKTQ